jgi:tRNA nucleotidyltransferase (CCA-adding enzyme)
VREIELLIIDRLANNGFEAFIVGGAVRDKLLGLPPNDIDFATNAKPEEIINLFKDKTIGVVGKSFKVVFVEGVQIATYRKDVQKEFFSAKYCEPVYADNIYDDLCRRDLTINAMAINTVTNEFIDIHKGEEDLRKGIIRLVGDPIQRLWQDPNRIVRACRFVAKTEGYFHKDTYAALCECAVFIKRHVEVERLCEEIMKAMEVNTPSIFFSSLQSVGALKYIFPAMADAFHQIGGEFHKETVGEHLMLAGDNVHKKFPVLRLAAFLHDIGKPKAFLKEGDGSFKAHEAYGATLAETYLKKLKFPNKIIQEVVNLISSHMRVCRGLTPRGIRRLRKHLSDDGVDPRSFLRLKLADRSANLFRSPTEIQPVKELIINAGIRSVEDPVLTLKDLAISGGDLIKEFNIKPGPLVGKVHKALLEFIVEEGEENNTYEILKEKAKELLE